MFREMPSGGPVADLALVLEDGLPRIRSAVRVCWSTSLPPGSPAATCAQEAATDGSGYEFENLMRTSAGFVTAALDNAAAVPGLLRLDRSAIPLTAVTRALLESSSRTQWLLTEGPTTRERLRRGLNEAVFGVHEMGRFMSEAQSAGRVQLGLEPLPTRSDPEMDQLKEELLSWGPAHGFEIGRKHGVDWLVNDQGQGRPSAMDLIDQSLMRGPKAFPGYGDAVFRVASAITHGSWHAQAILGHDPMAGAAALFDSPHAESLPMVLAEPLSVLLQAVDAVWWFFGESTRDAASAAESIGAAVAALADES